MKYRNFLLLLSFFRTIKFFWQVSWSEEQVSLFALGNSCCVIFAVCDAAFIEKYYSIEYLIFLLWYHSIFISTISFFVSKMPQISSFYEFYSRVVLIFFYYMFYSFMALEFFPFENIFKSWKSKRYFRQQNVDFFGPFASNYWSNLLKIKLNRYENRPFERFKQISFIQHFIDAFGRLNKRSLMI